LHTDEVRTLRSKGYRPWDWYHGDGRIRRVIDALSSGLFSKTESGIFEPIRNALLDGGDHYMHLADFNAYVAAQREISETFVNPSLWASKAILNVARMSKFSSDRTIQEYADDIWRIHSIP
jgi:glycogen phosphorylase